MRRTFTLRFYMALSIMILFSVLVNGQSPKLISYQAVVRDVSNQPVANTGVTVVFTIHSVSAGGTVVYTESHSPTTNQFGLISLQIGSGTTSDDLAAIDWSATDYFLNTNVDGNDMGTTQMISVPYALFSENAGNVFSGVYNDLTGKPDLGTFLTSESDPVFIGSPASSITTTQKSQWSQAYGWGNHTLAGYLLTEADPVYGSSAVSGVTAGMITNWNTAFGWGDHSSAGYISNYQDISLSNDILSISNSASSVDLSPYLDSDWTRVADTLYYVDGNVGIGTKDPRSTLSVTGTTPNDSAIFEVKNNNGQTVFAVYNDGVQITIDETAKGPKGGFAIGGFDGTKGTTNYMKVSGDSIRMYIDNSAISKGPKGGFAIGGFDNAKAASDRYLSVYGEQSTSDLYNTFLGYAAGGDGGGKHNTALGYYAGYNINTGSRNNVFIGDSAGMYVTSGYENILLGRNAGAHVSGGYNNIMIGYRAGSEGWNQYNVMIGDEAGRYNDHGFANVFLGDKAGRGVTGGYRNTILGAQAGWVIDGGDNNVMVGTGAGFQTANANNNTFVGTWAGQNGVTGSQNTYVGYSAGSNNDGSYNVFIGYRVGAFSTLGNESYRLLIDYTNPTTPDDAFISGIMSGVKKLRLNAQTSIKTAPQSGYNLTVSGSAIATAWNTTSDERLKKEVNQINNPLEKVLALRGVSYEWVDNSIDSGKKHIGFLAQEVEKVVPEVIQTTGEYYSMEYGQLTALLVEAMKELKKENDELRSRLDKVELLEQQIEELKALLTKQ